MVGRRLLNYCNVFLVGNKSSRLQDYISRSATPIPSASSSISVEFLDEVDTLTEDPNCDDASRATGYIGKASDSRG